MEEMVQILISRDAAGALGSLPDFLSGAEFWGSSNEHGIQTKYRVVRRELSLDGETTADTLLGILEDLKTNYLVNEAIILDRNRLFCFSFGTLPEIKEVNITRLLRTFYSFESGVDKLPRYTLT